MPKRRVGTQRQRTRRIAAWRRSLSAATWAPLLSGSESGFFRQAGSVPSSLSPEPLAPVQRRERDSPNLLTYRSAQHQSTYSHYRGTFPSRLFPPSRRLRRENLLPSPSAPVPRRKKRFAFYPKSHSTSALRGACGRAG
eukprot:scaffold7624_cov248-Pinguiococcus_pyrenoidosus.AAC.2